MKKYVALFLAVMMCLALVGCGSESSSAAPKADGAAPAAQTIKLGGIGPLTGGYANYGTSVCNGAKLAVEEINANGVIAGKQIEFDFQDSQGDPESAVNAYGKQRDWGM